jgi:hypothetical protein
LQQANLELQLCVRCGKFGSSLGDPLIELGRDALLLAQEPCFVQSDGCLIRRYAQKKCLGLMRKIRPLCGCDDYAKFAL